MLTGCLVAGRLGWPGPIGCPTEKPLQIGSQQPGGLGVATDCNGCPTACGGLWQPVGTDWMPYRETFADRLQWMPNGLWRAVAACGNLWQPIGCPIEKPLQIGSQQPGGGTSDGQIIGCWHPGMVRSSDVRSQVIGCLALLTGAGWSDGER